MNCFSYKFTADFHLFCAFICPAHCVILPAEKYLAAQEGRLYQLSTM